VSNKTAILLAALPLLLQLVGCVTTTVTVPNRAELESAGNPKPAEKAPADQARGAESFAEAVGRGDAAWQAGQLDRAIYFYVLALDRSPRDAPTLAKIGAIEEGRKNIALAQKAFEMAHAAQPDEPRIAERLGWLYLQQAKYDSAADVFSQELAVLPKRARALDGMGELCRIWRNYSGSIDFFDRAMDSDDVDQASVLTHRGYAKLLAGDLPGAGYDLRRALLTAPQPEAWQHLAELQIRQHDSPAALESLLKIMDTARAHNEIGVVLMSMSDFRGAARHFSDAISTSPAWYEVAQKNLARANENLRSSPAG
jgi:tetratricopeptide (TPR) repeat protein